MEDNSLEEMFKHTYVSPEYKIEGNYAPCFLVFERYSSLNKGDNFPNSISKISQEKKEKLITDFIGKKRVCTQYRLKIDGENYLVIIGENEFDEEKGLYHRKITIESKNGLPKSLIEILEDCNYQESN